MKSALASLFFVSAAFGQEPCAVEGRVVDQVTGRPLAQVRVFAPQESSAPVKRTITDARGAFCFARLGPGSYNLFAQRTGYVDTIYQGSRFPGSYPMLEVLPNSRLSPVTIEMAPRSILAGRVVDTDGDPITGAEVRAYQVTEPGAWRNPGNITKTDVHGMFRFYDLDPDTYYVIATPARDWSYLDKYRDGSGRPIRERDIETFYPNSPGMANAVPLVLEAGQEIAGLAVTMQKARLRHLSGQVTGVTGEKYLLADKVSSSGSRESGPIEVREDGTFYQDGLLPGVYTLRLTGVVTIVVDLTTVDVDGILIEPLRTRK